MCVCMRDLPPMPMWWMGMSVCVICLDIVRVCKHIFGCGVHTHTLATKFVWHSRQILTMVYKCRIMLSIRFVGLFYRDISVSCIFENWDSSLPPTSFCISSSQPIYTSRQLHVYWIGNRRNNHQPKFHVPC